ncbi:MAG: shikimate kinase [Candidatus Omnitrophica bacterium]|nr:shikimate kinase [Candidatus Omnitrophota bacterium]
MKNIYLVGFMGTGKTYVGKIIANRLGRSFVEMDETIEKQQNRKIVDIFAKDGQAHFRALENKLLNELAEKNNLIVSCGGGVICNDENIKLLKKSGVVFNLHSSAQKVYDRTKMHKTRPILNVDDPLSRIKELMAERAKYYNQADYTVLSEDQTPQEVAENIINLLDKNDQ